MLPLQYTSAACQLAGCETTLNSSAATQKMIQHLKHDEAGVRAEVTSVTGNTN